MAHFPQRRIRSIIFAVWQGCPDAADSFWDALNGLHSGKWARTQTGLQVTGSSGAGYQQSFHIPFNDADPSNFTDANLQDTFYDIIERYQEVVCEGATQNPPLTENMAGNEKFLQCLLGKFPTISGYVPNFMFVST